MSNLVFENVRHSYSRAYSVDINHLEVGAGKLVCLLGPSGCGKSTTLRLAAGLESPTEGKILIKDEVMADDEIFVGPEDRRVGLVFQDYALFPHLSVQGNVAFGLSHLSAPERRSQSLHMLETVGMSDSAEKYPHMLSGGEQQRVALARALAPNPRIILMDEPFSGLDVVLRNHVRDETQTLLKEMGTTVLMVTHDPEEAMRMADEIVLMQKGKIIQQGSAGDLYNNPVNEFVASFLGDVNHVPAGRQGNHLSTVLGTIPVPEKLLGKIAKKILVRPEAIRFVSEATPENPVSEVLNARNLGAFSLVELGFPDGSKVTARVATLQTPKVGESCAISLNLDQVFVFADEA
ncbi:ABC transporter ATP-binding protein [Sneathiella marina]|uniref:ABC transporter ATP-binding protein n=1 Tax=Sneathiella marina TaxID=2950108 RepID=A0ABY4VYH5_9PROT|nr:ABC transporter ATP-binding protein [Sneathiella marina]USG59883.1 ABC transporter ATP-binding protein [Sneathiella marina]